MAPRLSSRQNALSVQNRSCREAGVLVLLLPSSDDPELVLTVRHEALPDHGGQISFPGGQREGDESLSDAARREAHEEIGLPPHAVSLLGSLTPLYIPPSNFCVYPFLGGVETAPELHPTDDEVQTVLRASLSHLLSDEAHTVDSWKLHGQEVDVPYYDVRGHAVWGATAMMLAEVLSVIRDVQQSD